MKCQRKISAKNLKKMKKIISHITNTFSKNREEFIIELRRIFKKNEYSLNEKTRVEVRGYFDEDECRAYIQFDIDTDEARDSTEFYRDDFSRTNRFTKDESLVLKNEETVVKAFTLFQDDIVAN